jgi:hypothetical protein
MDANARPQLAYPRGLTGLILAPPGVADDGAANRTDSPERYGPNGLVIPSSHFSRVRRASVGNASYSAHDQAEYKAASSMPMTSSARVHAIAQPGRPRRSDWNKFVPGTRRRFRNTPSDPSLNGRNVYSGALALGSSWKEDKDESCYRCKTHLTFTREGRLVGAGASDRSGPTISLMHSARRVNAIACSAIGFARLCVAGHCASDRPSHSCPDRHLARRNVPEGRDWC